MRLISLILLFLLSGTVSAQKVEWYTTTQTSPWVKQKVKPERTTTGAEIVLDPAQRLQLITGIGGCFNEMGWDALNALSAEDREAVLQAIFGKDGACFDYCRLPMGANDFAMSFYSSADVAGDFNPVSYTHLRAHETGRNLVCRLLLEKKKEKISKQNDSYWNNE